MPPSGHDRRKVAYVAAGVRADFDKLIENFKETRTVRYESFSQIWKSMKITHIFRGRQKKGIVSQFVFECLRIASEYWLLSNNLQVQIGGLYLYYGLFETQPCEPKRRLMLTLNDYDIVMKFVQDIQEQSHYDVCYIYRKLQMKRAFHFGASNKPIVFPRELKVDTIFKDQVEKEARATVTDLLDQANISQLEALHKQYHVMKCALAGPNCKKPDPSLRVINSDLVDVIKEKVEAFEKWKKMPGRWHAKYREESDDQGDKDFAPGAFGRSLKASIKERAFKSSGKVRRDRRHRQQQASSEEDGSRKKRGRKRGRGSVVCSTGDDGGASSASPGRGAVHYIDAPQTQELRSPKVRKVTSPSKTPKVVLNRKKAKMEEKQDAPEKRIRGRKAAKKTSPEASEATKGSKNQRGKTIKIGPKSKIRSKSADNSGENIPTDKVLEAKQEVLDVKQEQDTSVPEATASTSSYKFVRSTSTLKKKPSAAKKPKK